MWKTMNLRQALFNLWDQQSSALKEAIRVLNPPSVFQTNKDITVERQRIENDPLNSLKVLRDLGT